MCVANVQRFFLYDAHGDHDSLKLLQDHLKVDMQKLAEEICPNGFGKEIQAAFENHHVYKDGDMNGLSANKIGWL